MSTLLNLINSVLSFLHKILVTGALSKGWGGPECRKALNIETHVIESITWLLLSLITFYYYNMKHKFNILWKSINEELKTYKSSTIIRFFEISLSMIHFGMFLQIVYYKVNILSLVNMVQPCHVILLLQGIALYSNKATGVIISLCILPALTGTLLAMLFPDVDGLDQPYEMEAYWIQHYLIQVVPLYLLLKSNAIALKHATFFSTAFSGLWILAILHFAFYEIIDLSLNVNVEFMLCPTSAMVYLSSQLPVWVSKPSWRTTMTFIVLIVGSLLSYLYIAVAYRIHLLLLQLGIHHPRVKQI